MDAPISPAGYPPPTLVRQRSGLRRARMVILLLAILLVAAIYAMYAVGRVVADEPASPASGAPPEAGQDPVGRADSDADALPDSAAGPRMVVEQAADDAGPVQPSPDARKPNRWYYVERLGDGPGVIYSHTGGQWNFAFACTLRTKMIEFIAVGTGAPGDFTDQSIEAGKARLMMDAGYSQEAGGTIITTLPAAHPFLDALDGSTPMEIRLHASRKTIVPVGPDLVRLVKTCRGRG